MLTVGSSLPFRALLYDKAPADGGQLVNAQTVTLSVQKDGVSVGPTVPQNPPAVIGVYTYDAYTATLPGRYVGAWTFVMTGGLTATYTQVLDVQPSDTGNLISLWDAKEHLNIPYDDNTNDAEILSWLTGITPIIEFHIGACIPRTVVEYAEAAQVIRLEVTPVLSVQSITPYLTAGYSYSAAQIRVTAEGRMMLLTGLPFAYGPLEITYTAGRSPIPPNVGQAVKIILGHLWETQRGASGLPLQAPDDVFNTDRGMGFAIPNRALELLRPHMLGPGVG